MKIQKLGVPLSGLIILLAFAIASAAPPRYKLINLGTFSGAESFPGGINQAGQVGGTASTLVITGPKLGHVEYHPFFYSGGSLQDLGTLGGKQSYGFALNDNGKVVGRSALADNVSDHAFLFSGSGPLIDLGTLGGKTSAARGINNSDQIVGDSLLADNTTNHAFLYSGTMQDLGVLDGTFSLATGINGTGQISGYSNYPGGASNAYHAFRYFGGVMTDLGTLGGATSYGLAVNSSGEVAGYSFLADDSHYHAFITRSGTLKDLGTLIADADSQAAGLNSKGDVVGNVTYYHNGDPVAALFSSGAIYDLNTRIVAGGNANFVSLIFASVINDNGWIAGLGHYWGNGGAGLTHFETFLAIPQPPLPPPPIEYKVVDLGTLGGTYSAAVSINNSGQVVGYSLDASNKSSHATLFAFSGGKVSRTDLGIAVNSNSPMDISDTGEIVAAALDPNFNASAVVLTLSNGAVNRQDLPGLVGSSSSVPAGINSSGQVVGYSNAADGKTRAVLFSRSGSPATDLGDLGGNVESIAFAINDNGAIAGHSYLPADNSGGVSRPPRQHAVIFSPAGGIPKDLGVPKDGSSAAFAINRNGEVAGNQYSPSLLFGLRANIFSVASNGTVASKDLTASAPAFSYQDVMNSSANSINDSGQATGIAGGKAFLYSGGTLYDLNDVAAKNLGNFKSLDVGNGINNNGWIVGNGTLANGQQHAFLAMPVALAPSRLLNIATRLAVQGGENVLIGGFIITGTDPKRVIIRAIGPSLSQFFNNALDDPSLELFQGNTKLAENNDWKETQQAEIEATGIPPSSDKESAIVRTLAPGSYTAIMRGNAAATGIGIVELYDLGQASNSKLANIATRGFVAADNNVMIGGFIVGPAGGATTKIVVRAIGPSLAKFGIAAPLLDPTVDLVDSNGVVLRSNNDWKDAQESAIMATGLQPSDPRESAIVEVLPPGNYTAIVRGAGGTTGVALFEAYHVE